MTSETSKPQESAIEKVSPQTQDLVEKEMPDESDEVKQKMMELIEAIKKKAQSQAKAADDWTRDAYLQAVRQVEENITKTEQISEDYQERLKSSIKIIEDEAQQSWDVITKEVELIGDRLAKAADAAWSVLTTPKPDSQSESEPPKDIDIS